MKSKNVAYLLWFFFGWLGIHRFYCRKWISGFLWLVTLGLLGVGWFIDGILTSKMVDEANALVTPQVPGPLQQALRRWGMMAAGLFALVAIAGISSLIAQKLDKRTPEEKAQDALQAKIKEYRELKRDHPSMALDGKVVPVQVTWGSDGLSITMPKTYGFGATRFRQQTKAMTKDDFRRLAKEYEGNYFMNVGIEIWSGPSPSFGSYCISIPKRIVPDHFFESPVITPPTRPIAASAPRKQKGQQDFKIHDDPKNLYSISYPSSWGPAPPDWLSIIKEQVADRILLFMLVSPDRQLNLQLSILNEPAQEGETLQNLFGRLTVSWPMPVSNVTTNTVEIGGITGIRVLQDTSTPEGLPAKFAHLLFVRKGHVWVLGIGGNKAAFERNRDEIERLIGSIKFDPKQ